MRPLVRLALDALAVVQAVAAARVLLRMSRTAGGRRIGRAHGDAAMPGASAIVPVLDEEQRVARVLDGLVAHGPELREILVVDGGSRDGTLEVVARYALLDPRVRYLSAAPVAEGWNGKAWGLACGLRESDPRSQWILTVDADVWVDSRLVPSLVAFAQGRDDDALSVATLQEVAGPLDGLVHPALLTTLVYRFGLPGYRARSVAAVQANGQCFFARREALVRTDAFAAARASRCEDVTVARRLFRAGYAVGFYESAGLATVRMYENWRELVEGWPRSLALRDRYVSISSVVGWIEVALVQGLPLAAVVSLARTRRAHPLFALNGVLMLIRLATLAGTARAYRRPPVTYWLSPLADLPAAVLVLASALRRRHRWRGRLLVEAR